MKKLKNILSAVILLITFALVIMLVVTKIQGNVPELFGYQILRVSSSSMTPTLEVGDIILSKSVDDVTELKVGDIITYRGEVGGYAGKTITHEVTVEPYESGGKFYLQTMGIANGYADPEISEDQVIGKMVCTLPVLSSVYSFFMTPWGLAVILGFLAVLFINEVFTLRRLVKETDDDAVDDTEADTAEASAPSDELISIDALAEEVSEENTATTPSEVAVNAVIPRVCAEEDPTE